MTGIGLLAVWVGLSAGCLIASVIPPTFSLESAGERIFFQGIAILAVWIFRR